MNSTIITTLRGTGHGRACLPWPATAAPLAALTPSAPAIPVAGYRSVSGSPVRNRAMSPVVSSVMSSAKDFATVDAVLGLDKHDPKQHGSPPRVPRLS